MIKPVVTVLEFEQLFAQRRDRLYALTTVTQRRVILSRNRDGVEDAVITRRECLKITNKNNALVRSDLIGCNIRKIELDAIDQPDSIELGSGASNIDKFHEFKVVIVKVGINREFSLAWIGWIKVDF